jgi:hypothetical protein
VDDWAHVPKHVKNCLLDIVHNRVNWMLECAREKKHMFFSSPRATCDLYWGHIQEGRLMFEKEGSTGVKKQNRVVFIEQTVQRGKKQNVSI